jgi:hypothetical protein
MTGGGGLAQPGAGVPFWQRWAGRYYFLPRYCRRLSWDAARELLVDEGHELIASGQARTTQQLTHRVLIPPQIGLEDSSRCWSFAMVLEHLAIIGGAATEIIVDLTHGRCPSGEVRTAVLKPGGELGAAEAAARLGTFLDTFARRTGEEVGKRDSTARFEHPWFGPLTARQWICFLPFHQRIHIRQARTILGRVDRDQEG